ncbi:MAG: ribosome small subunit-dependent GTPase A [Filifactoraceae bacterium]
MKKGLITKAISSFFYVYTEDGVYECKGRGSLKEEGIIPLVGDMAIITIVDERTKKAMVEKIEDRKNFLIRPPIANIGKVLLTFAIKDPNPNLSLIDRFVVLAQEAGLDIVLCFTKSDLDKDGKLKKLLSIYKGLGYPVIWLSVEENKNIDLVKSVIKDNITVVAGPSGAGKSTMINTLGFEIKTGEVSQKLGRGRHTTRHVELLKIDERTWIADTPGFSSLSLDHIPPDELKEYFIEFHDYDTECRFGSKCIHDQEPDCCVKKAVDNGNIAVERYESYIQLLGEVRQNQKRKGY